MLSNVAGNPVIKSQHTQRHSLVSKSIPDMILTTWENSILQFKKKKIINLLLT